MSPLKKHAFKEIEGSVRTCGCCSTAFLMRKCRITHKAAADYLAEYGHIYGLYSREGDVFKRDLS